MISNKKLLSFLVLFLSVSFLNAQDIVTSLILKGNKPYDQLQYSNALEYYRQAYSTAVKIKASTSQKESVVVKIADCYWLLRNYDSSYYWYNQLPSTVIDPDGQINYRKAELNATMGNYEKASSLLSILPKFKERSNGFLKTPKMMVDSADWSIYFLENLNTGYFREYSPILIDSGMIWTTNQPKKFSKNGVMAWDNMGYARMLKIEDTTNLVATNLLKLRMLYDQQKLTINQPSKLARSYAGADVELLKMVPVPGGIPGKIKLIEGLSEELNGLKKFSYNLAHATYNASTSKMYFSSNLQGNLKNQTRSIGIVEATKEGSTLVNIHFAFPQTSDYSTMHPAIHPNGTTLVYSSNQEGGEGSFDLYYVEKETDTTWSKPRLVEGVNTAGNELFPTFGNDGILYFSSDGQPGLGGLDLYKVSFSKGIGTNLIHFPLPINSSYDDFGITITVDGKTGYFTSDRYGTDDIFKFNYEKKYTQLSGFVLSEATGKGKAGVKVKFTESQDGVIKQVDSLQTDKVGEYTFNGRPNRDYSVTAIDPMDTQSISMNTNNEFGKKRLVDIILHDKKSEPLVQTPIKDTVRFIIYFESNKSRLNPESTEILNQVIAKMNEDAFYNVTLYGHTDLWGDASYNKSLASDRTNEVKQYLQKTGITSERISLSSFGESQPAFNETKTKNSKLNRRVEITIIK